MMLWAADGPGELSPVLLSLLRQHTGTVTLRTTSGHSAPRITHQTCLQVCWMPGPGHRWLFLLQPDEMGEARFTPAQQQESRCLHRGCQAKGRLPCKPPDTPKIAFFSA